MKRTIIAVLLAVVSAGAAGALELESLNLKNLPPSKAEIPTPGAPAAAEAAGKAAETYRISCKYKDAYEVNNVARLDMRATYTVLGNDSASLAYKATLTYLSEKPAAVYFAVGDGLKNEKYSGVNYPDHFKFPLRWHGVSSTIEWGNLIISRKPVSVEMDEYGATVRKFSGALDVSYNDHHGDYVKVVCTQREFEDR